MANANPSTAGSTRPAIRVSRVVLAGVAGVGLALVAGLTWLVLSGPDTSAQPLTLERLTQAKERWRQQDPQDYELQVSVRGQMSGDYYVKVRGGRVVRFERNGYRLRNQATWTVPQQFEYLERELVSADRPETAYGVSSETPIELRAEFNPQYGFADRFWRHVRGSEMDVQWKVTRFEVPGSS